MNKKIDFKTLKAGKVIPNVWVVTRGIVYHEAQFKKLSESIYDTHNGDGWGVATHLDSFFTSELEATRYALNYRLKQVEELKDRITELENQSND